MFYIVKHIALRETRILNIVWWDMRLHTTKAFRIASVFIRQKQTSLLLSIHDIRNFYFHFCSKIAISFKMHLFWSKHVSFSVECMGWDMTDAMDCSMQITLCQSMVSCYGLSERSIKGQSAFSRFNLINMEKIKIESEMPGKDCSTKIIITEHDSLAPGVGIFRINPGFHALYMCEICDSTWKFQLLQSWPVLETTFVDISRIRG